METPSCNNIFHEQHLRTTISFYFIFYSIIKNNIRQLYYNYTKAIQVYRSISAGDEQKEEDITTTPTGKHGETTMANTERL